MDVSVRLLVATPAGTLVQPSVPRNGPLDDTKASDRLAQSHQRRGEVEVMRPRGDEKLIWQAACGVNERLDAVLGSGEREPGVHDLADAALRDGRGLEKILGWNVPQKDELGMRVGEAGPRRATLVDEPEDPLEPVIGSGSPARVPGARDQLDLLVAQLGERALVPGRVDHDLLPLDRGVEVRHHSHDPLRASLREAERLGRRPILASGAKRALVELLLLGLLDPGSVGPGSGSAGPPGSDRDEATRDRVASQIGRRQLPSLSFPGPARNGLISSIGAGKTIVEALADPISRSV